MILVNESCSSESRSTLVEQSEAEQYLAGLPGWTIKADRMEKTYQFSNYLETIAFVNGLAWVAHQEDHHPDLSVHYGKVIVVFTTHDAQGLTLNDFICAAKTEALLRQS